MGQPRGSEGGNAGNRHLRKSQRITQAKHEEELAYYVKNNVLKPIGRDYVFSALINPVYRKEGNQVQVLISVKYLDQLSKATQISRLHLTLEKDMNWIFIK
ncbi:MAG: conjugal transfer protein [Sporolactobacillus sp.]|nr:conjugal transfer protein [Sporolactobacillus sp.]